MHIVSRRAPARSTPGSRVTNTPTADGTSGTTAIGHVRLTRARTGSSPITATASTTPVTGKATTASSPTIIDGTEGANATKNAGPVKHPQATSTTARTRIATNTRITALWS